MKRGFYNARKRCFFPEMDRLDLWIRHPKFYLQYSSCKSTLTAEPKANKAEVKSLVSTRPQECEGVRARVRVGKRAAAPRPTDSLRGLINATLLNTAT